MRKTIALIILLATITSVYSQKSPFINDHAHYLKMLENAKDSLYQNILSSFDEHIAKNPGDYRARLERCKVIQNAYVDSYEDENPNYDLAESCSRELLAEFPDIPEVVLFRTEFLYGDSAIVYLEKVEGKIKTDPAHWKQFDWKVYKQLAENYSVNENHKQAIYFATLAAEKNDTLDLTLLLGKSYQATSDNQKAIEILSSRIDSSNRSWELNQKGKLLLELGAPDKAIEAFHLASKDTSGWQDVGGLAQALIENNLPGEARKYLVKEIESNTWNRSKGLHRLLEYDLNYSVADSAMSSYNRMVQENFWNDPFAIYRLRLFFKAPFFGWSFNEIVRLLLLLLLIVVLFIIPYLWILPIHVLGNHFKNKGIVFPRSSFKWGLRHFWIASFSLLAVSAIGNLIFNYGEVITLYFNDSIKSEETKQVSQNVANHILFFCSGCLLLTLFFLKKNEIILFWPRLKRNRNGIIKGIGLALVLRVAVTTYIALLKALGISLNSSGPTILSIADGIASINQFYHPLVGLLFVAILVPLYEEILFRGIFLSACERNMKFLFANILQSLVFAMLHQEWKLFPFFFTFGMIAGHYRNKTQSLVTGTAMHITNNFVVFLGMLASH